MNEENRHRKPLSENAIFGNYTIEKIIAYDKGRYLYKARDNLLSRDVAIVEYLSGDVIESVLEVAKYEVLGVREFYSTNGAFYLVMGGLEFLPSKIFVEIAQNISTSIDTLTDYIVVDDPSNNKTTMHIGVLTVILELDVILSNESMIEVANEILRTFNFRLQNSNISSDTKNSFEIISVKKGSIIIEFGIVASIIGAISVFFKEYPQIKSGYEEFKKDLIKDSKRWARCIPKFTKKSKVSEISLHIISNEELKNIFELRSKNDKSKTYKNTKGTIR